MSDIRYKLINETYNRAYSLMGIDIDNNIHKRFEFKRQFILDDKYLTNDEKNIAIRLLNKNYDRDKVISNEGTKRFCENCNQECLATLYCEYCVRNYLKANFSNWTSGNSDIDNLIQKCQIETLMPEKIIEWIPYDNLKNVRYLTKGGFSEIYTAVWVGGFYDEWDSEKRQLKRVERPGIQVPKVKVILKSLENVESARQSWFEEVCNLKAYKWMSHFY